MSQKKILEEASKLFKSAPMLRGGLVMGIQLVRDSLQLTAEQKAEINEAIDIISGVTNYRKPAPRPSEIKKIEDTEAINPVTASESETKELPHRDDSVDLGEAAKKLDELEEAPGQPKLPEKIVPPKEEPKPKIRRPWDKDPNVIRRPKR